MPDVSVPETDNRVRLTESQALSVLAALREVEFPAAVIAPDGQCLFATEGFRRERSEGALAGIGDRGGADNAYALLAAAHGRYRVQDLRDEEGKPFGTLITLAEAGGWTGLFEELASHVAHEIRNPLGTIGGFASLLEREFSPEDRRRRWVRKIIDAVARLDRMVTQLHLYVKPVRSQLRPVDLVEKTREVFSFAEVKYGAREASVTFEYLFPSEPVYVLLDPHWWQEVILIICSNAIQALGDGGRVSVEIRPDGEVADVVIADNGAGIPEEMHGKLFYPFFSSKPDGTGLGLAVARKLLHSMDAAIDVSPGENGGTVVTITFRLA